MESGHFGLLKRIFTGAKTKARAGAGAVIIGVVRIFATGRPFVRPFAYLLFVGAVCFLALYLNRPLAKPVEIDATCSEFEVPASFTSNLSSAYALLESTQLFGFEGEISKLQCLRLRKNSKLVSFPQTGSIQLRISSSAAALPYLQIRPGAKHGLAFMALKKGVVLRPGELPGEGPRLRATSTHPGDVVVYVQSDRMSIEAARYSLRAPLEPTSTADLVDFEAVGTKELAEANLKSTSWGMQSSWMEVHFPPGKEASLLKTGRPNEISLSGVPLTLGGCVNPNIQIGGERPENTVADRELNLVLELGEFNVTDISLNQEERQGATVLRLRGGGEATSVKQGGRELMPTWIEEVLAEPYMNGGLLVVILGLGAVFLFKLASRALEVIVKLFIPD